MASDKNMLVPDVLYNSEAADKWMRQLQFVEGNEIITSYHLQEDKAQYLYAWPAAMKSLLTRYFSKVKEFPFAAYQFYKPFQSEHSLLCTISNEYAYATLYNNRALQWHQAFPYHAAEDIAYKLQLLCQQHGIEADKINLQCTAISKGFNSTVHALSQYFPQLKDGTGNVSTNDVNWTTSIYLFQQLYACAL